MKNDFEQLEKLLFAQVNKSAENKKVSTSQVKAKVFERIQPKSRLSFWSFKRTLSFVTLLFLAVPILLLLSFVSVHTSQATYVGQLYVISGKAVITRNNEKLQVTSPTGILVGDQISLNAESTAEVLFVDHTKTLLSEDTSLTIQEVSVSTDNKSVKKLTLHKGEVKEQKVLDRISNKESLTQIQTPTGLVRSMNDASYILNVNPEINKSTLIVTDKTADIVDLPSLSDEKTTPRLALSAGEMASFTTRTNVDTNVLETLGQKVDPIPVSTLTQVKEKLIALTTKKTILSEKKIPELPQSSSLDVLQKVAVDQLLSDAEIAQVKLLQVVQSLENKDSKDLILEAVLSYTNTVKRIKNSVVPGQNIAPNWSVLENTQLQEQIKDEDPILALQNSKLTDTLYVLSSEITEDNEKNRELERQMLVLYSLENTLKTYMKGEHEKAIQQQANNIHTNSELYTALGKLESTANGEEKVVLRSALKDAAKKRVQTVLTPENEDIRTKELVEYLNGFSSTPESYKLLEMLQKEANPKYKGYFSMRLHQMKYSEGVTGIENQ